MGTYRHYTRFTPAELERARGDAEWAEQYLFEVWEATPGYGSDALPVAQRRMLDINKFWTEFDPLLHLAGIPVATHLGVHRLYHRDGEWAEVDGLGRLYGGATYLTPDEVAASARVLAPVRLTALLAAADPAVGQAFFAEHGGEFFYAEEECAEHDRSLGEFFGAAAAAGDAVVAQTV
jgi:hypothetical protein